MAGRKFLTNIDLQSNELQNAVIHKLNSDPTGVNGKIYYNTVSNKFRVYQDGAWKDLATGGSAASTVTLTGDVTGTANVDPATGIISVETTLDADFATEAEAQGYADTAESNANSYTDTEINALTTDAIEEGSVNLYFTNQRALDATSSAYDPAGSAAQALSDANDYTDTAIGGVVASVTGTTGEIEVSGTANDVIIGLPDDVTIAGILTVTGDLNVEGNLNAVNRTEINLEDNTIVLNTGATGTPSVNAGIQVDRGDEDNASLLWDETLNVWKAGTLGSEVTLSLKGHFHEASDITDFNTAVDNEIDSYLTGSDSISISSGAIDTTLATTSYLTKTGGLAVDKSTLESALVTDGFTKKYAVNVGDETNTSFAITHGLGSRDVQVQVYDNATYDTVEVDVVRTSSSVVTISFNVAPDTDAYRVVIVG
jgi:hypothetical protein